MSSNHFTTDGSLRLEGNKYKLVGELEGSTHPKLYKSKSGKKVVVKRGQPRQNIVEHAAQQVMRTINKAQAIPKSRLVDGFLVNDFVTGMTLGKKAKKLGKKPRDMHALASKVRRNAATDALIANWDVVGLEADNIIVKGSEIIKIDAGGAFHCRANGMTKKYSGIPIELVSMKTRGQFSPYFERASEAVLKDYWGAQTAKIVANSPKLRKLISTTKLPAKIKKAFADRLEVFRALSDSINKGKIHKALQTNKFNWKNVDRIACNVLGRLTAMRRPPSGDKLRVQTEQKLVEELHITL